jgi:hypothetical protein
MGEHKCKVAFNCGEHAVYEEIAVTCPYCRIAELEQRPAVTDAQIERVAQVLEASRGVDANDHATAKIICEELAALNTGGGEG